MDAEQLLEHFDRVTEAPGSIAALRRFILDLAVRGKLVDQDPNDEPASKKFEHLAELTNFDLATGWLSGKFGDLLNMQYGKSLPKESREKKGKVPVFGSNGIVGFTDVALVEQSVIVIGRKGSAGAINLCSEPSWTTDVSYFIIPPNFFDIRFLLFSLESLNLKTLSKGVKPGLSRSEAYQLSISIPSLAEQHRIVAKVDELMDLCDRLEAAQKNRENLRDRLVAASLHQLNQAADSNEEFFDRARFYFDNLAKLSVRSEHIKQLRQNILNLAVSGKLTSQNPNDEPASKLLDKIKSEKEELIARKITRKEKPLSSLKNKDFPFAIPSSWEWVKIGVASLFTEYGTSQQSANSEFGVPVLKMGDIQEGKVIIGNHKKVPETIDDLPALYLKKFDLLYNRTNSAELVGKTGIYLGDDDQYTFASYLIRIRCSSFHTNPIYFNLAMNAPFFRVTQILPYVKQQCGQANVNGTILKNMAIPLPPLAEQHLIISKVDKLMLLCDQLEHQISNMKTDGLKLLNCLLQKALS